MFKRSFFYRYFSPYGWTLTGNIALRLIATVFNMLLVFGFVPFLSILFYGDSMQAATSHQGNTLLDLLQHWMVSAVDRFGRAHTLGLLVLSISGLYILKNAFTYWAYVRFTYIKNQVLYDLRNDLFLRLLILPLGFYGSQRKGDLLSRLTSDVQEIDQSILQQIEVLLVDLIITMGMLSVLLFLSPLLMGFTLLVLPLGMFMVGLLSRSLRGSSAKAQADLGRLMSHVEESLTGAKVIQSSNAQDKARSVFQHINQHVYRRRNSIYYRSDLASPLSELLGTAVVMAILVFGGYLVLNQGFGHIGPELLITFLLALTQILNPAKNISNAFYSIRKGKASVRRVKDILYAQERIEEDPNPIRIATLNDRISFKDVSFAYHDNDPILKHIDLTFEKNKSYALVGPSGAGKSTLVDLLARFYDIDSGQILIDGIPIQKIKIEDLRSLSAIVSQDTVLFNDTIFNNIAFADSNADVKAVEKAAQMAFAHDFIMNTEAGYQTIIGDMGTKLSGGQRQRISLARALLKNAPVLILDEATSALDSASEALVHQAIEALRKERTIIAVAHRLSSIRNFDMIVVMNQGQIIEMGTHEQLLALKGLYAELVALQGIH